ncbi:MAG TPA: helix-turn-helix domain-containing protein [Anaerolineaceae bacterium]|nr:helix-turn-helix domain-containing protein [Anaerolineaceae bacterium]
MGQRTVTLNEREQIYLRKRDGCSLRQIAHELGISYECVRKG